LRSTGLDVKKSSDLEVSDDRPLVDVVCAVIQKPNGEFLLAQRPAGKVYEGYWEFPGGKVEPGESIAHATSRELNEELGIMVEESFPWLTRKFSYPHAHVRLHFRRVTRWRNAPRGRENQAFAWQDVSNINVKPLLPANGPILAALSLPTTYGITHAHELGEEAMLRRLERALHMGLRLIQVREKDRPREKLSAFAVKVISLARRFGARVLLNGEIELAREFGADGVHLTASRLMALSQRPDIALCGASCHDARELLRAEELDLDFVVVGSVLATPSHPNDQPLGWDRFLELTQNYSLPIFALGGLSPADQQTAWRHGAHGLAMLRNAWPA
jgi:8-oxo-dGTP diphosphatase